MPSCGGRGELLIRILFSASLCLCGLSLGCGKEPPPPTVAPPPVPPAAPEVPPPADVAFPDWKEVDDEKFLELPKPATPDVLQWDFSPGQRFGHEVTQKTTQRIEQRKAGKTGSIQAVDRNRGTFEFIAGKDRTALVLLRFHTEEAFRNEIQATREEIEKNPPTKINAIAKEDGTAEIKEPPGRKDALFFFDALLALQPGERTLKDGWVRTRAAGHAKVERYECLRLESEFEFNPTKASFGTTLQRGRTIAYFALAERRFVRASSAVALSTRMKARDEKDGAWIVTLGDSFSVIRLKIVENP